MREEFHLQLTASCHLHSVSLHQHMFGRLTKSNNHQQQNLQTSLFWSQETLLKNRVTCCYWDDGVGGMIMLILLMSKDTQNKENMVASEYRSIESSLCWCSCTGCLVGDACGFLHLHTRLTLSLLNVVPTLFCYEELKSNV